MSHDAEATKLYEMGQLKWPKDPPEAVAAGETYRSQQVYRCEICHTHTNEWEHRGRYGAHLLCPVGRTASRGDLAAEKPYFDKVNEVREARQNHHDILKLLGEKSDLKRKYQLYSGNERQAPAHIQDELVAIQDRIGQLREWFDGRYDDVVGVTQNYEIQGEFAGE